MLGDRRDLGLPDRNHVGKWREVYYRDIEAKTASLFAATTEMAAILAGAEEIEVTALRRYGRELGLAFQIVDDVLDLTSDASHLGKPVGSDLRQGTITLPVLCYVEMGERNEVVGGVLRGEREEAQVRAAVETIRASGAIEAALAEARDHAGRSQEALASLPDNAWRGVLRDLAEYVVRREH
jgi:geranylgeranyl pyrophosphate synthase